MDRELGGFFPGSALGGGANEEVLLFGYAEIGHGNHLQAYGSRWVCGRRVGEGAGPG